MGSAIFLFATFNKPSTPFSMVNLHVLVRCFAVPSAPLGRPRVSRCELAVTAGKLAGCVSKVCGSQASGPKAVGIASEKAVLGHKMAQQKILEL